MKERIIVGCFVAIPVIACLVAARSTDLIFVAVTVGFFLLCIAYAEGCERL
jgi:succinate-acetate transporter protein